MTVRLSHIVETGAVSLPAQGDIVVLGADATSDLTALPRDRVVVVCGHKPDHDALTASGYRVQTAAPGAAALAMVFLTRSKAETRALIAQGLTLADMAIIDGQKHDGVDSVLRELRKRMEEVGEPYSKAHGKIFVASRAQGALDDWARAGAASVNADGYVTCPGVFSSDAIDPASRLLAAALPAKLCRAVADFGAGWGYLAREILTRDTVERLDLVEADLAALDCARENVTDPRARFHWADATTWRPETPLDGIVMNPPFHQGRKGVPALGQAFIRNAAAALAPSGRLWMVANRHLPYEQALGEVFRQVEEVGGDRRFKLMQASRPARKGR